MTPKALGVPVPAGASDPVSPFTGRLMDARREATFRRHAWGEWASRLRVVALVAAVVLLGFGYTDYLTLGFGPALYACWASRLAVLAGAILVAWLCGPVPRVGALDAATFALMIVFGLSLFVVVGLQAKGIMEEMPGALLMVLGYYLFVPTRFESQLAAALFVSGGFLLVSGMLLAPAPVEWITAAIELLICNLLGAFTALRTHALHRREFVSQRRVRRRARFEEMIARLSTRFIRLPAEALDQAIDEALAQVGEFSGVDRAYVFEFDVQRERISCTHEWCRDGVAPALRALQEVPFDAYAWGMSELLSGRAISAGRLDELPAAAAQERATAAGYGVRSLLVLPLVYGQQVLGAIGFHAVRAELRWDEERIAALRMVGEMIMGVVVQQRTSQALLRQTHTLEASVAALEQSNAELQRFAYVASHDLQEPLRSISSFSSLLARRYAGKLDEKADEYIAYLTSAADRMHILITDLLEYSRLDARAQAFEHCDPAAIAQQALENLHASVESADATVSIAPLPGVRGDATQLLQLFQNLIGNALKFHDGRRPVVNVFAERCNGRWVFSVADNGIGIDPKHAQRVFTIFTRLHPSDRYPGTGIGLAACRRIVERHGGRIWVEPNVPHGSIFRFTLPVAD